MGGCASSRRAVGFQNVADAAFNQIRQYGRSSAAVIFHLLEAIETLAGVVRRRRDRVALQRHAKLIHRCCVDLMPDASDREDLDTRFARVMDALQAAEKASPK